MNPVYGFSSKIDFSGCRALYKARFGKMTVITRAVVTVCDVVLIGLAIYLKSWDFSMALALLCTALVWCMPLLAAWGIKRSCAADASRYAFFDDHMTVANRVGNSSVEYSAILNLRQTKTHILLFIHRNQAFVLAKSDVESPDGFARFLEEKTGKAFHA